MRFFARFGAAVLLAGVVGLAACGNTPSTGGSTPVVQLTPAQVSIEAQALPAGVVPADVEAGITAFQFVVDAIEPLVVPPSTAPVTAPTTATATKPVHPAKGLPFRVVLVPNDK
jgi:hypothetical protein